MVIRGAKITLSWGSGDQRGEIHIILGRWDHGSKTHIILMERKQDGRQRQGRAGESPAGLTAAVGQLSEGPA